MVISCAYTYLNTYLAPGPNTTPLPPSQPSLFLRSKSSLFRTFARIILLTVSRRPRDFLAWLSSFYEFVRKYRSNAIISNYNRSDIYIYRSRDARIIKDRELLFVTRGQLDDVTKWNNYPTGRWRGRSCLGRENKFASRQISALDAWAPAYPFLRLLSIPSFLPFPSEGRRSSFPFFQRLLRERGTGGEGRATHPRVAPSFASPTLPIPCSRYPPFFPPISTFFPPFCSS